MLVNGFCNHQVIGGTRCPSPRRKEKSKFITAVDRDAGILDARVFGSEQTAARSRQCHSPDARFASGVPITGQTASDGRSVSQGRPCDSNIETNEIGSASVADSPSTILGVTNYPT